MVAFLSLLGKSKPAKLTSFIGEYLMHQVGWSILLGWTCPTHLHEWCLFTHITLGQHAALFKCPADICCFTFYGCIKEKSYILCEKKQYFKVCELATTISYFNNLFSSNLLPFISRLLPFPARISFVFLYLFNGISTPYGLSNAKI